MGKLKVSEIFSSIDGEGSRSGYPVTFIRLHGCNLSCSYCDSQYACLGDDYTEMEISDVVDKVAELGLKRITLTGGEPLLEYPEDENIELIRELLCKGYFVNVETNGSIPLLPIRARLYGSNLMFTIDYKCNGSGMNDKMCTGNLRELSSPDVLKFVVKDIDDLNQMKQVFNAYPYLKNKNVYVSPVFDEIDPKDIVKFLIDNKLEGIRLQLQLHKLIWDPNDRGV